jgi:hypothetical protein
MSNDTYAALAAGDPLALAACHIPPRIVARAAAARKARASPPSPVASAARGQASIAASAIAPAAPPRPSGTLARRRAEGNAIASRQGVPTDQAAIDAMWSASATRLNAKMPSASSTSPSPRSASRAQGQADVDSMWASLVAEGNRSAGLATPIADRAR